MKKKYQSFLLLFSLIGLFNYCKQAKNPEPILPSNSTIQIKNLDKFPADNHLSFSKLEATGPSAGDTHDEITLRINNVGKDTMTISDLQLSDNVSWKIFTIKNNNKQVYTNGTPLIVKQGTYVDITLQFVAHSNQGKVLGRVKILHETLTIISNADNDRQKVVYLHGMWQAKPESNQEPYVQEIIDVFGLKTQTGFDQRNTTHSKPLEDEVYASYFLRANNSQPVYVRQLAAFHSCCTSTEAIFWQAKGSASRNLIMRHDKIDGQTIFPRKVTSLAVAEATFSPNQAFSISISDDSTDPNRNGYKEADSKGNLFRGARVWKVRDFEGNIIPNTYLISHDYLSAESNFDYNDNIYYLSNIKPE